MVETPTAEKRIARFFKPSWVASLAFIIKRLKYTRIQNVYHGVLWFVAPSKIGNWLRRSSRN
jgi:hypothetical protein